VQFSLRIWVPQVPLLGPGIPRNYAVIVRAVSAMQMVIHVLKGHDPLRRIVP
jgi:hypothetical protein